MANFFFLAGLLCYCACALFLVLGLVIPALERFFDQAAVEWRELFTDVVHAQLFPWLLVAGGHSLLASMWFAS